MDSLLTIANKLLDNCYGMVASTETANRDELGQYQYSQIMDTGNNGNAPAVTGNNNCLLSIPCHPFPPNFDDLPDISLTRIFSYLNPSDLLHCRLVSRRWTKKICKTEHFLKNWTLQFPAKSQVFQSVAQTTVEWENMSILYLDTQGHEDLDWTGVRRLLTCSKYLEFRCCVLSWPLVRRLLSWAQHLKHLSFASCIFIHERTAHSIVPRDDNEVSTTLRYLTTMKNLKILTLEDIATKIDKLTSILIYMISLAISNLERLEILFDSNDIPVTQESAHLFHFQILQLMYLNQKSLKGLFLNLRDSVLVSTFCSHVLDNFPDTITNLEEFQLTPFVPGYDTNIQVSTENHAPMLSLTIFFHRHQKLKNVSFPHFNCRQSTYVRRRRIVKSLPKSVEKLHLPGFSYLTTDFLSHLPNLKYIFLGPISRGRPFHPNSYRYTPHVCERVQALGVNTRIHLSSGKLSNFSWKFPALTRLEFDAQRSVINDKDIQAIILNCRWLRHLSIFGCDLSLMLESLIIYANPPDQIPVKGKYKPLSSLKGLRTLLLRGNSQITDVGIYYGFRFQEVKSLWVPYNERITGWGFRKIRVANPSLESLGVTKATPTSSIAIEQLTADHPRVTADRVVVQTMSEQDSSSIMSTPTMLTAICPEIV